MFVGVRDLIHELALVCKVTALLCSLGVDGTCAGGGDRRLCVHASERVRAHIYTVFCVCMSQPGALERGRVYRLMLAVQCVYTLTAYRKL